VSAGAEIASIVSPKAIFCSPCHAKCCIGVGEFLCAVILKTPHRHFVFSVPKILRIYFLLEDKRTEPLAEEGQESGQA